MCSSVLQFEADFDFALAYFMITEPNRNSQWVNGVAHPVKWTKGANDGVVMVDVELSRLTQDGLIFVARNGG